MLTEYRARCIIKNSICSLNLALQLTFYLVVNVIESSSRPEDKCVTTSVPDRPPTVSGSLSVRSGPLNDDRST